MAYCPEGSGPMPDCAFYLNVQEMTFDVPEPSSLGLFGLATLGLLLTSRKRRLSQS